MAHRPPQLDLALVQLDLFGLVERELLAKLGLRLGHAALRLIQLADLWNKSKMQKP